MRRESDSKKELNDTLSITFVGAEYPVNLGYTARLMKNFGLRRLYLVDPKVDMRAASVYASHGSSILEDAETVSLSRVRKTHNLLLGTTAIRAKRGANIGRTAIKPEEAAIRILRADTASIVFGRDTTGLTNDELSLCDLVTSVDTRTAYRTLNVSHSVAILLYLTSRAWTSARGARPQNAGSAGVQSWEKREAFSSSAYRLAITSGMQSHRAARMVQVARRVALKSEVSSKELGLLISLMRKAEFVIREKRERQVQRRDFQSADG
jgi:TrmH family RNA methyltransferase